jgi:hypothetical protein
MAWTDDVSPEQWQEWLKLAKKLSGARKLATSLGYEDLFFSKKLNHS